MKLFRVTALLSVITLGFGLPVENHHRESRNNQSRLGIIGGKNVKIESYPFMVSVKEDGGLMGAGVILNEHWILTSAVTVYGERYPYIEIRIGSTDCDNGGEVVKVEKVVISKNYTGEWAYDVGLVKVKKPFKFSKTVKKIKLGSGELKNGTKATLAGWGGTTIDSVKVTEKLKVVQLTVLTGNTCSTNPYLTTDNICTYDENAGGGTFDWGDPLIVNDEVYGIFLCSSTEVDGNYPMIYTDVTKYKKYIEDIIST